MAFVDRVTVDGTLTTRNGEDGTADAWGRVVPPGGVDTVGVLRATTRLTETIPLTIGGFPIALGRVHNVNAYYPLWGKFPVLRTVSDS
ncbi:MAG: hypothetical protein IPH00_15965 [Flavobacteriales bacterium]|nr:hypothetical protein [Flavobacteriales bacterium]